MLRSLIFLFTLISLNKICAVHAAGGGGGGGGAAEGVQYRLSVCSTS